MKLQLSIRFAVRSIVTLAVGIVLLWGGAAVPSAAGDGTVSSGPANDALYGSSWWAAVQADIRRSEYEVTWQEQTLLPGSVPAYQAPNRAHNLRTHFVPAGIRVIPRVGDAPAWQWGLTLTGYGPPGDVRSLPAAEPTVAGNRVEYRRRSLVEWYTNDERGLEQGFTLYAPPDGVARESFSEVHLELAHLGDLTPNLAEQGAAIEYMTPEGVRVLRYGDLYAYDATGRPLSAHLSLIPVGPSADVEQRAQNTQHATRSSQYVLCIKIRADGAAYPITVDPLITTPAWTAESNQDGAWFGRAVATAGDVNGDGYADVIVGAPYYDGGQAGEGRVYVYHGSASGLQASAAWTVEGNQIGAQFGSAVGTAGDVNGDTYADVIVGAPRYDAGQTDEGRVYVYHGSVSGLQKPAAWIAEGNQVEALFGYAVSTAGDVNGDGYADVIVGAPDYDADQGDEGRVSVYHGSSSGLTSGPADWTAVGASVDSSFGRTVDTAGDVNGDGFADVIIGEPGYGLVWGAGRVCVYHGSSTGLSTGAPDWNVEGDADESRLGTAVSTAGDVNGDGYADVIIGDVAYGGEGTGRAQVYYGSSTGLSTASPDWTETGSHARDRFGHSVSTAGDVNGDGYADIIVGALNHDYAGDNGPGRAYVYLGSSAGLETGTAAWTVGHYQDDDDFGYSTCTAGDVNGDGFADIIVGAPRHDAGQTDEGRAYVFHGGPSGLAPVAGWTMKRDQAGAQYGYRVSSAGDVNGDGYADVVIGVPFYDAGQVDEGRAHVYHGTASGLDTSWAWRAESNQAGARFGISVGAAGDVNNDGYADLIVGASHYSGGQSNEGQAYLYHGSASGLDEAAAWTVEGNQENAYLGATADAAGDVNGDGYADVIVGAGGYDNDQQDEGRAYVYHGSASGLHASADWTAEGNQVDARFGLPVGTAGDVNGDGYADVVIGARRYDGGQTDEGRVFVYHGSSSGLHASADWTAESDQAGAEFGRAASAAGDVNGDGYADLIVGAPLYDGGQADEGRVYLYRGSASGLRTPAVWSTEGNQAGASYGYAAGTAGDVNGDGYADIAIGAPGYDNGQVDEGRVDVYHGRASWPAVSPADGSTEGDQDGAAYGFAVGAAGDVNGDGYADLVVGAPRYDTAAADGGQAYLYYGNGGPGLSLNPRQRREDNSAPIAHLGKAVDDAFRLAVLGRTPFGRGRVRLQWEVKPLGTPFDGTGIKQSNWVDTGAAGAQINRIVSGLEVATPYHWRVRLRYHTATTPLQQYSRWFTMPWNGWQEQDLRSGGTLPSVEFRNISYSVLERAGTVTIRVDLSSASSRTVTVDYATGDGTATAGQDYVAKSGTLTFSPGVTSRSFSVTIVDDAVDEPDETVLLSLSNPTGATLGANSQSTLTLLDDDDPPRVDFSTAAYSVSEGMRSVTIQVGLNVASPQRVTVDYATSDGTASAGSDYQATSGTLTFEPGVTQRAFNIPLWTDLLDEADETVVLTLSNPQNATLWNNNPATLTILDDDDPPAVDWIRSDFRADEDAGTTTIVVVLDAPSGRTVQVDYATGNGTASAPGDYSSTSGTLTFPPGDTDQTFEVPIADDALDEEDETVLLTLSNAVNATLGGANNPAVLTLVDDDDPPTVDFSRVDHLVEEGMGTATIAVFLSVRSGRTVTVDYATGDGTANAPGDYSSTGGTLTFPPGDTNQTFEVSIVDDALDEGDETVVLTLSNAGNATLGSANNPARLTIRDNDGLPTVDFERSTYSVNEGAGTATVSVVLDAPSSVIVQVRCVTSDGTARAPGDYQALDATVTFQPGDVVETVAVPIVGDGLDEGDETVTLTLSGAVNAVLGAAHNPAVLSIVDDDDPPVVRFERAAYVVSESAGVATISVVLDGPSGQTVTVDYATSDGTARAPGDYGATGGTLTFAPGETRRTFPVAVVDDGMVEGDETVLLRLSNASHATLGLPNPATLTLSDTGIWIYLPMIAR